MSNTLIIANYYRIKAALFLRQLYVPGVRGVVAIILVNLIIVMIIRIATKRLAAAASTKARTMAKPATRQLAYALSRK